MDIYEIRVSHQGVSSSDVYSSTHVSDYAAVRRARNLAASEDFVEVWRGGTCVYFGVADRITAP